ncbi:hypothetical protein CCR95_19605 [Thiocystis minor]|nr:hypothetical protein [Thiocystis minor]
MKPIDCGKLSAHLRFCWVLLSWLSLAPVMAADWQGTLPDGSRVEVDASTHRAWHRDGNRVVPLWDGVHQLEDGSVVIVRDGTAVPTTGMLETWVPSSEEESPRVSSACDDLIKGVCGADNRCATSQACGLAHQLAEMAAGKSAKVMGADARIKTGDQCREALANPFFVRCD